MGTFQGRNKYEGTEEQRQKAAVDDIARYIGISRNHFDKVVAMTALAARCSEVHLEKWMAFAGIEGFPVKAFRQYVLGHYQVKSVSDEGGQNLKEPSEDSDLPSVRGMMQDGTEVSAKDIVVKFGIMIYKAMQEHFSEVSDEFTVALDDSGHIHLLFADYMVYLLSEQAKEDRMTHASPHDNFIRHQDKWLHMVAI